MRVSYGGPGLSLPASYLRIAGFKSISPEQPGRLDIRGLTLLAGGNSSGKSALMQPILLLKQTLEASYDPGPLLLDGPHVQFTAIDQMLWRGGAGSTPTDEMAIEFGPIAADRLPVRLRFVTSVRDVNTPEFATPQIEASVRGRWLPMSADTSPADITELLGAYSKGMLDDTFLDPNGRSVEAVTSRLDLTLTVTPGRQEPRTQIYIHPIALHLDWIRTLLHLPGLRGHRDRLYPTAHAGDPHRITAPGPFTPYVAPLLARWQATDDDTSRAALARVTDAMHRMGLTSAVYATRVNAAQIELKVGRLPGAAPGDARDLVDLADVGFGVSQVLPVVVALAAAAPGQIVYVEQPELHLHPRAQLVMGQLLVDATNRGVKVIVETHSRMILRAIQTAVARRRITPEAIALHWFSRGPDTGATRVDLAELDADGAFGEWPVDFADAEAEADDAWLDAVMEHTP